jgi:hypothetical protein
LKREIDTKMKKQSTKEFHEAGMADLFEGPKARRAIRLKEEGTPAGTPESVEGQVGRAKTKGQEGVSLLDIRSCTEHC